ncbi:hypothetical protein HLPCO_001494 [Haloplasma contractile SSD-17B]|uniref:Uncharacterized protein n=2 Tax=Haloplasma TaxID=471824 RepID=U2EBT7_9MOLU|nr:hypothetical protein HLPCO_001494 [Haloplasma contractile SSD-17B]
MFFIINLVPYICSLLLLGLDVGTIEYNLIHATKSLFSIPTSLIWFIIQNDIGEIAWIIFNIIGCTGTIFLISQT